MLKQLNALEDGGITFLDARPDLHSLPTMQIIWTIWIVESPGRAFKAKNS